MALRIVSNFRIQASRVLPTFDDPGSAFPEQRRVLLAVGDDFATAGIYGGHSAHTNPPNERWAISECRQDPGSLTHACTDGGKKWGCATSDSAIKHNGAAGILASRRIAMWRALKSRGYHTRIGAILIIRLILKSQRGDIRWCETMGWNDFAITGQTTGVMGEQDRWNMRELTIRAADGTDARAIAHIYVASWNAGFRGLLPQRHVDTNLVARWEQEIVAPLPHRWWVAEVAGVIVGFTGIGPSRDPIDPELGELDTIAVDPSMWRRGIGRALLSEALHFLIADGYREAVLWTLAGYEQGQRFYEDLGWRLDGATRDEDRQVRYYRPLVF